jgi:nucleoside-diphosphate-sugar epimerase
VTILRPCAIHGVGSSHPREWWFVKRMLDGRAAIPLAFRGESRFHTTAAANIAGLVGVVAEAPATRILNIGDDPCLSVAEIGAAIGRHLGYGGRFVLLDDDSATECGFTPWSVPAPFVIDSSAARALGFAPLSYEATVGPTCDWLVELASEGDWRAKLPVFGDYPRDPFDYRAEDEVLSRMGLRGGG